jgi:ribosome biogenesis protein Nip4
MTSMDNYAEQQHKSCELKTADSNVIVLSDNEWTTEATIDVLLCNLASVEQTVTNKSGRTLTTRKYQSRCRILSRWIPVASPTPEYFIYTSDLKPEVREALEEIHPELRRQVLHQAVLRLFEAVGIEPYISIGRKLSVKLIED